jgi:hypothetical protein
MKTIGGTFNDEAHRIIRNSNGNYVIAGATKINTIIMMSGLLRLMYMD